MDPSKHTTVSKLQVNRKPPYKGSMAVCGRYWYVMSLGASVVKPDKPIL